MDGLLENHAWDIVTCLPTIHPIGCKCVYIVKLKFYGTLDQYGNGQEYGIDYVETLAPVLKMTMVRTMLAISASQSWPMFQMDMKNAFLPYDFDEVIYLQPP